MLMRHATNTEGTTSGPDEHGQTALRRAGVAYTLGYGVVLGLVFPLMISSTFLQEMSLSHGAGSLFGLLFFASYTCTMLANALVRLAARRTAEAAPEATGRIAGRSIAAGLAFAFAGNVLMLLRQLGADDGSLPYTVAMAMCIGFGLATAELGWLARLAAFPTKSPRIPVRICALAYLVGCASAAVIFWATGVGEIVFALATIAISVPAAALWKSSSPMRGPAVEKGRGSATGFIQATAYLAVFSFVFGAVSQMSSVTEMPGIPIEVLALLGIAVASCAMVAASCIQSRVFQTTNLYWALFPIVAATLVVLPFIQAPLLHVVASALVFVAFYLTGINVRVVVCRLGRGNVHKAALYASAALGIGSLCILAGVILGASVLTDENQVVGLALISLVSLFVLSLSPVVLRFAEERLGMAAQSGGGCGEAGGKVAKRNGAGREDEVAAPGGHGWTNVATATLGGHGEAAVDAAFENQGGAIVRDARVLTFAQAHGMTARETEVVALVCQGRTRTYIADELGISPNTVKGYIHTIYQKAHVADKQGLIDQIESSSADRTPRHRM